MSSPKDFDASNSDSMEPSHHSSSNSLTTRPSPEEILAALGESMSSMEAATDQALPPETTKPEPNGMAVWSKQVSSNESSLPAVAPPPRSLTEIMMEQEREARLSNEATNAVTVPLSVDEEEEMLVRIAMERSMADVAVATAACETVHGDFGHPHLAVGQPTSAFYSDGFSCNGADQVFVPNNNSLSEMQAAVDSVYDPREAAATNLSAAELEEIEKALNDSESSQLRAEAAASDLPSGLSPEDVAAIQAALQEAKQDEEKQQQLEQQSLLLALQLERELSMEARPQQKSQGNVRVLTRDQLNAEGRVGAFCSSGPTPRHPMEVEEDFRNAAGFRMNTVSEQEWNRRGDLVVGPDNELLTKHDAALDAMANAHRLGLDDDNKIGNKAFNSFRASVKRTKKGVASHGTGRAGSDATRNGVVDPQVRALISKAINSGMIDRCHGIVKEGKEAVVCHASKGEGQEFDVAVKIFKRITEFKGRADYVHGDSRSAKENFRKLGSREQLHMWAEKEHRNLVRANRAGVPVATPLAQNENVLFMRFFGTDGWPAPQLRELDLRRGSKRWGILYIQVMDAVRKLYVNAKLIHADLSEYNIMVVPAYLVENMDESIEDPLQDLQAVLIDFGQAVDRNHPEANWLLERDLDRVDTFFATQGVEVMEKDVAFAFVTTIEASQDLAEGLESVSNQSLRLEDSLVFDEGIEHREGLSVTASSIEQTGSSTRFSESYASAGND
ncbi:hypothetical protein MPSEU_000324900 [Mayamaea pseudoterrestris]|nr:hypothetical protein MPSEU_000324900 [Mayamaea pseudoterrestris]